MSKQTADTSAKNSDRSTRKKKKSLWKKFALIVLAIQAVLSVAAMVVVFRLNMLPMGYVAAFGLLLALIFLLSDILMVLSRRRRNKTKSSLYIKRSMGLTLSSVTIILCLLIVNMLSTLIATLNGVSVETIVITESTAVYVLADDPAEDINEAEEYTFGYTPSFDYENTVTAIEKVEKELKKDITTQEYETVVDMVDALYHGSIGALFLNESYVDILEDMEEYANFSKDTRVISVSKVEIVQQVTVSDGVDKITDDPFVVYLSGSDTRNKQLGDKTRSDVNILAVINPQTRQILLVNTPRDYYIELSVAPGQMDKLTHCGMYGIDCSMDTLGNLYNVDVNYYLKINFTGFEKLIDAIGGITIKVDKSFTSVDGYKYQKGEMQMNGTYALNYVRERKAFADGDISRGKHQMQMIKALVSKLSSGAIITNYSDIMKSI